MQTTIPGRAPSKLLCQRRSSDPPNGAQSEQQGSLKAVPPTAPSEIPPGPNVRKTLIDRAHRDEVGVDTSWMHGKKP
jgi:hypothetical protein